MTAYEVRISDWSSDVCSSDLDAGQLGQLDGSLRRYSDSQVDEAPSGVAIGGIECGQQPGHMRVWREQPHHGHRVDGLASGTSLAVGEKLRALRDGGEWLGHGRHSHKSTDARLRFHVEAQNRQTGFTPSCASTDALEWLCRNPPMRISCKAPKRKNPK